MSMQLPCLPYSDHARSLLHLVDVRWATFHSHLSGRERRHMEA